MPARLRTGLTRRRRLVDKRPIVVRGPYDRAVQRPSFIVVDGWVPADLSAEPSPVDNLRDGVWSFALDQRAFGPRKLWVTLADEDGTFRGLAYTDRTDPPDLAFEA